MTSRFGKTYSRKGGDSSSKFDEVLSNKRATLSTKWGETTFKAQLGSKRPGSGAEVTDTAKRARLTEEEASEDPFGFDSDDDSKPVTSRVTPPVKTAPVEPPRPERSSLAQEHDTHVSHLVNKEIYCEFKTVAIQNVSDEHEGAENNSNLWYKNASERERRPVCQASSLKTESKDSLENWQSASERPTLHCLESMKVCDFTWMTGFSQEGSISGQDSGEELVCETHTESSHELKSNEPLQGAPEPPPEPLDLEALAQPLSRPPNCRTYRRPNRCRHLAAGGNGEGVLPGTQAVPTKVVTESQSGGRGRTRDYTVLHPSCLSVCNVTIQDSMDRSMEEFTTASAPADLGEAGRLRRKTETLPSKPARFRPTQSKSKKETKLEFFGFDENEGQEADGDPMPSGSTSYKIKYFGFDDLSESDSDEDDDAAAKRKAKKISAPATTALSMGVDSPQPNILEFSDDSSPAVPEIPKRAQGKQVDKSKDNSRRIFSAPKKVITVLDFGCVVPFILLSLEQDSGVFKPPPPPPKVTKCITLPTEPYQDIVTTLKCRTEHKELYTVVQHVKHFNDVVEFGENQEFTDDFEYLETGLKSGQPLNTRCLSIISLATRCAMPSFRMHLRARGKVAQVFKTLSDAPQHPNLALCTASLMYILSRDRLNMDLDRASLDLMIRLLELEQDNTADDQLTAREMGKVKEKIRKLCETVHNKHLDLENITTGHLAMETLLSLTSKRAGDWFKEELRMLGGLDHIVDKVKECVENLGEEDDKEKLVASLWGAERCLRVLESVTVHNPENQGYLIAYKESQLIVSSAKGLRCCEAMIQRYSREASHTSSCCNVGKAVEDCMRSIIGVLLNLTHDNEWGSTKTGEQENLIVTALNCVLRVPQYLPQEQRFDIRVLGLGLLINLVEYSARNRHCLVEMEVDTETFSYVCQGEGEEPNPVGPLNAISALVQLFLQRERAAVLAEAETDEFISDGPKPQPDQGGEWQETSGEIQWVASENSTNDNEKEKKEEDEEELDLNKALQHAGKHMEDSIVASYTALLLGCLCQESPINVTAVRDILPRGDFSIMTEMLKKFLNFMNLTCAVGTTGQKSISRVIDYLEHC
uniref:Wings apart-like protein homolog n=1 Tax=Scleropages formosus TaxID=113540 RepID=A0A8D0CGE6_SCLFO